MHKQLGALFLRFAVLVVVAGVIATTGSAQLNENCTVSVLNRTTQARPDGSWILPEVPANSGLVRARATCVENGITRSGQSNLFLVPVDGVIDNVSIAFEDPTPIPVSLTLEASLSTLATIGSTSQLAARAVYPSAITADVTAGAGTTYFTSNPIIATVTDTGLVTARGTGTVLLSALHEGALGMTRIAISTSGDADGDGMPDDYELSNGLDPSNPADAQADADGDGLKKADEFRNGTNPRAADSDSDGIADGEEAVAGADGFVTNPLLADTDGDGLRDALEVSTGSDPTNRNSYNLARALSRIAAAPTSFTLIVNTLVGQAYTQLAVTGTLLDGTSIDLTSTTGRGTSYASSDLSILNFGAPDGRVFAGREGAGTITVTNNGFTSTASGVVRNFSPVALSVLSIPGYANNVDVRNGYAFVAAGSAGLQVVRVANPEAPAIVAARSTGGNANDVRIVGNLAYIANGFSGLAIVDVSNPLAPVVVGSVSTSGEAMDVMVSGTTVYVANGNAGLSIVNAANAAAPIVVGSLDTPGVARGVDVSGNFVIVADDTPSAAARVIDVTVPTAPVLAGSVFLSGSPKDVRVSGTLAYFAAYTGGMQIVDISTPAAPRVVGSLPGSSPNGFVPRDVEVAGQFAIFAEQLYPNAVPFVDVTQPSTPLFKGILNFFPLGDYAGTGIAVDGAYVYMTGESFIVGPENGTSGNTRLFIGQYLPLEDYAGNPPRVAIAAPASGSTQYEGDALTIAVDATDDVAVAAVVFSVGGQDVFTDTSAPYEHVLTVPAAAGPLAIGARATDLGANVGTAPAVTVNVVPDPLTTVTGVVVDANGSPIPGATATTNGGATATTASDGTFLIAGVTTVRGSIIVSVQATSSQGILLTGSSSAFTAARGGTTNVGTISAVSAVWESNYGTYWTNCDDCYQNFAIPFPFPFYGTAQTNAWVGTNGYITFGQGDWTYTETLEAFAMLPRIAAFFDDLYGRSQGAVYVNSQLPGRFVVTYLNNQHYSFGGSNTLQIILYADGRIQFGYRGITARTSGTITGLTPGPGAQLRQVNFSDERNVVVEGATSLFEYFLSTSPFDLDYGFIIFTPQSGGGYTARTILQPPPSAQFQITNAVQSAQRVAVDAAGGNSAYAQAEIEVTSSRDKRYKRNVNTNKDGIFTIRNVPAGAINITVRKKGQLIAVGSVVIPPDADPSQPVVVTLAPPAEYSKNGPNTND